MRKRFEQQKSIDTISIPDVKILVNKRDELGPVLLALQHIFVTPELNEKVFQVLESSIPKKKLGRTGMNLWQILVLGVIRMCLCANYARLWDLSNKHVEIRSLMGIQKIWGEQEIIGETTIRENVSLLNTETLEKINTIIVDAGHHLLKKKDELLNVKADTYVLEANVHFPTDINLLFDAARKCLDIIKNVSTQTPIGGWRKIKVWYRDMKNQCRALSQVCKSGGKNKEEREKKTAHEYLRIASQLNSKIQATQKKIMEQLTQENLLALMSLEYYQEMLEKHIDLVERRLIKGETIPHEEKLFSIFEPHVEWVKKGKSNNKVELGHNVLIATDQFGFILYHKVVDHQADVELTIPLVDKIHELYGEGTIKSLSTDKGFYKKTHKEILQLAIPQVIMPKKGKLNTHEKEEESSKQFKKLRHKHSAVESDINSLEHHGANRCPDKGFRNFKKYAALAVLSLNVHRLGNALIAQSEKAEKRKQRKLAQAA